MSSSSKIKGSRVEREAVRALSVLGEAEKVPLSGALENYPGDVWWFLGEEKLIIEVKARKDGKGFTQLNKWKKGADMLLLKENYKDFMVYISLEKMLELINA